jgi:hypothetical protein
MDLKPKNLLHLFLRSEAKAKEAELKTEAKAKEAEAQVNAFIKNLMRMTILTDEQLVTQFGFPTTLVASIRAELDAL